MTSWSVAIVLYGILVVGGGSFLILCRGPADRDWIATRPLPCNHRISKHDLKEPLEANSLGVRVPDSRKLEGRFIINTVTKGAPVTPSNLRPEPALEPRLGQSIYWLPLAEQPPAEAILNAGMFLDLCGKDKECFHGQVAALYCDEKTPPACFAGVWLTDADRGKLLAHGEKPKLAIFVSASRQKGE